MLTPLSVAATLSAERRQHLAIQTLARTEPVSRVAARAQVSRQFLYRQKRTVEIALNRAFAPVQTDPSVLCGFTCRSPRPGWNSW